MSSAANAGTVPLDAPEIEDGWPSGLRHRGANAADAPCPAGSNPAPSAILLRAFSEGGPSSWRIAQWQSGRPTPGPRRFDSVCADHTSERWPSGLRRRSRKPESTSWLRGFESHPLRHTILDFRLPIFDQLSEIRDQIQNLKSQIQNPWRGRLEA